MTILDTREAWTEFDRSGRRRPVPATVVGPDRRCGRGTAPQARRSGPPGRRCATAAPAC